MRKRNLLCQAILFWVVAISGGLPLFASEARADLYGLVVGIDQYNPSSGLESLDGAVNDARDIEDALKTAGAKEVKLLLDKEASRDNIMKSWDAILSKSHAGDLIVFSYAGHGSREDEHIKGSEPSGKDSVFVLGAFDWKGAGTYERIIDDEIAGMLKKALDKNRSVILIADSCHSGTMTRGRTPQVKRKSRLANYPPIKDDHLPPLDPKLHDAFLADHPNLLYIGAVQDYETVTETEVAGKARGALSWAFAKAMRGDINSDADGKVSGEELQHYIVETIRMQMEGSQHPSVVNKARGGIQVPVKSAKGQKAPPLEMVKILPKLRVSIIHAKQSPASLVEKLKGVTLVEQSSGQSADLVWDITERVVRTASGDVVAFMGQPSSTSSQPTTRGRSRSDDNSDSADIEVAKLPDVQKVIDKWRLVGAIKQISEGNSLSISLKPHDGVHPVGGKMSYSIDVAQIGQSSSTSSQVVTRGRQRLDDKNGNDKVFLTLFNLSADDTVNFLYPLDQGKIKDPLEIPDGKPYNLSMTAEPPLGADHIVAIASAAPLTGLHQALKQLDGKPEAETVLGLLHTHLAGQVYRMGIHGSYTGDK